MARPVEPMTLVRIMAIRTHGDLGWGPGWWRTPGVWSNIVRPVEVRPAEGGEAEQWNAVIEGWFSSRADAEAARARIDGDGALSAHLLVEERLIHDSGDRPLPSKIIVMFRRRADLTRAQAQAHWQGPHVRIGLVDHRATDFLNLYFQNHVLADNPATRPQHDYDGLPEYWLDEDALGAVGPDSAVMRAIAEDEDDRIDARQAQEGEAVRSVPEKQQMCRASSPGLRTWRGVRRRESGPCVHRRWPEKC